MKFLFMLSSFVLPYYCLGQPLIDQAVENYIQKDWKSARMAYQKITSDNPYNGVYWYRYGYACLQTNHLEEAIKASEKAIKLGVGQTSAMYNIGSAYALKGDQEKAMDWLEKAVQYGYQNLDRMAKDKDLKSLRKAPRFQQLINPTRVTAMDRVTGWRSDLAYLTKRMEQEHKNLFHTFSKTEWEKAKQQLHEDIAKMNDLQIIGAFMEIMVKIGDGHTVLYPPFQGKYAFKALPLEFYFFKEDLLIRAADPKYAALVGTKVLKVGAMPIAQVIASAQKYLNRDNQMQLKWTTPIALLFSDLYQLIGASANNSQIEFTVEVSNGSTFSETVEASTLTRDPQMRFAPEHWVGMRNGVINQWTKDPDNFYWYEYLQDRKVVYCQFNQIRNKDRENIAAFSKRLFQFINSTPVEALIIDIRLNNGGNNFLNQAFIHEIIRNEKINQHGKLFTIIGRRTFSAAMNLASDLENHTKTLFVGEPTGSKPNFYGEDNEFVLPFSGLMGSISSRYWQGGRTSDDVRPWIAPHLVAELSATEYQNNVDPALEVIFEYLEKN